MSTKFFTNRETKTLTTKFSGIFEYLPIAAFKALVGYFRISGYYKIHDFLKNVEEVKILVGIDIDKYIWKAYRDGIEFHGNVQTAREDYLKKLRLDIQTAPYSLEIERGMMAFLEGVANGKVQIKAHPSKKIHAKLYVFLPNPFNEHTSGSVITGSSNLTEEGLEKNFELNVELRDYDDVHFANSIFEELWAESVPISPLEIQKVKKETFLNDEFSPYELYLKFLAEYFGEAVNFNPDDAQDLPESYARLRYQVDAMNTGFHKLQKFNGFFLADVVGLGKTIVATMIARRFYLYNGARTKVLVVHPPALKNSWESTIDDFNLPFPIKFINNGSLHKIRNPENYDLIIVDEAHKFRSDTSVGFDELQRLCKTQRRNPGPKGELEKKVILVSATPLNNKPEDIRNLILLFQDGRRPSVDSLPNLISYFRPKIELYNQLKNQHKASAIEGIKRLYEDIRQKIVSPLTVRRTRTDLWGNDEYREDLLKQGISFPKIKKPTPILYQLDENLNTLFMDTIKALTDRVEGLQYNRFQAIKYLHRPARDNYKFAESISERLAAIMKTFLVKRLDSSFHSFIVSLGNYRKANAAMIKMFESNRIHIAPILKGKVTEYIADGREDELIDKLEKLRENDPSVQTFQAEDFQDGFLEKLKDDQKIIDELHQRWKDWDLRNKDPKVVEFIERLNRGDFNNQKGELAKLVVFSEYTDTTEYLESQLKQAGYKGILTVSSKNVKQLQPIIKKNFDARLQPSEKKDDFKIIVTTEVLAEGVNLHQSNIIINYDTPWNSTRLMQRIGRVNRIGTEHDEIHIFNFYPTEQTESQIELHKKAFMKLQAFHTALGEDSQIYSDEEEFDSYGLFEKVEDENEQSEELKYLLELRNFKKKNPDRFREIQNLPKRARTGRKNEEKAGHTVVYLKNNHKDSFYLANEQIEEISFLECAANLIAEPEEPGYPMPDRHFEQVQKAVNLFKQALHEERREGRQAAKFGPNERNALNYLGRMANYTNWQADEKELIQLAQEAVINGRFQRLQRDINQLRKGEKAAGLSLAVSADKLMEILNRYPFEREPKEDEKDRMLKQDEPQIIISEAFIK